MAPRLACSAFKKLLYLGSVRSEASKDKLQAFSLIGVTAYTEVEELLPVVK